jgi:hypothetical protein
LGSVVQQFAIAGDLIDVRPLQRGHIHDTFVSSWARGDETIRYLHQRMNDKVFHDIPAVMHNIETVSRHLREKMAGNSTLDGFRVLDLVETDQQRSYLVDDSGQWRTYNFIENTTTYDHCSGPDQAFEAAKAFGWFQSQLADLDAANLRETLPKFFSTPHRLQQFEDALAEDPRNRKSACKDDIQFAQTHREMAFVVDRMLKSGDIPIRTVTPSSTTCCSAIAPAAPSASSISTLACRDMRFTTLGTSCASPRRRPAKTSRISIRSVRT